MGVYRRRLQVNVVQGPAAAAEERRGAGCGWDSVAYNKEKGKRGRYYDSEKRRNEGQQRLLPGGADHRHCDYGDSGGGAGTAVHEVCREE